MPTIEEQKEVVRKMLASSPQEWIYTGAFMLSHSALATTYCATDYYPNFSANDHNGVSRVFNYVPISYELPPVSDDLAVGITITVADLNSDGTSIGTNQSIAQLVDQIDTYVDANPSALTETIKITLLVYISYPDGTFSDVAEGPYELEVANITFTSEGCAITAKSPDAIFASCGETYTVERFPMLRQYL